MSQFFFTYYMFAHNALINYAATCAGLAVGLLWMRSRVSEFFLETYDWIYNVTIPPKRLQKPQNKCD